ncbi:hypothetical protein F993_01645 [Acinetobacter proteolyticus]|uniref:DUF4760 domain-containing protein n=1 Tax=Acinetobacter proteolyticus TaxID=1776741 RepID=A0ABN0JEC9_9GAMM|nr:hypothetical protein [Acinetobacter proteolyticus]ENU23492.1 hypothetical protein F993_01645 [Acinetobacter proteolyticus]
MDKDIKKFLKDTCVYIVTMTVIFFCIIFLIMFYQQNESAFKDAMDLCISFFSALATLGAAIIAAKLFETWKDTQSSSNRSELAKNIQIHLLRLKKLCDKNFETAIIFTKTNEYIRNPPADAPLSPSKILEHENERLTLQDKNNILKQEYNEILDLLRSSIDMYKFNYEDLNLNDDSIFEFNGYQRLISGLLTYNFNNESAESIDNFKILLKDSKKYFEDNFFDPILDKTSPYINFNKN